jgi:hypothetical protein
MMNLMMKNAIVKSHFMIVAAAGNNPLVNGSNFLKEGIQAIAMVIVGAVALSYFKQKQITKLIGFTVTAAIILLMVFEPTALKTFGSYLWHDVLGM